MLFSCHFERRLVWVVGNAFLTFCMTLLAGLELISKWHGPIEGPITATILSGLAPRERIVSTVFIAIFLTVPCQPECATAITLFSGS